MKKTSKLFLLFAGAFLLTSVAIISCNSGDEEKKDAPKDSVTAPKMDPTPAVVDSLKKVIDTLKGKGKPNPMGS